jgi:hypothetical protein
MKSLCALGNEYRIACATNIVRLRSIENGMRPPIFLQDAKAVLEIMGKVRVMNKPQMLSAGA